MSDFAAITEELTRRLKRAAPGLRVIREGPEGIELMSDWVHPRKPGEAVWFGGVRLGKAYVSYHLMPVYSHPALAAKISPALKKRMQGKSCFNFKAADQALFDELEALTREGAALYAKT
ncbi:hypothetical protein [Caulobacter sp. NIBR1757]|uniref:hypothetical protein n=1 Tax=Caulobacter sp. NIBR1757 TaxID=3016000 RepID=UPI0022F119FF|nr:hypothetical protein [Caulobacter sp. NIBR1757]WGM37680.1 hypothetical protein AMEJIAPC_00580 [Caulobacter sp. NIBR1757]